MASFTQNVRYGYMGLNPQTRVWKHKSPQLGKIFRAQVWDGGPWHGRVLHKKHRRQRDAITYRKEVLFRWAKLKGKESVADLLHPVVKRLAATQRILQGQPSSEQL